MAMRVIFEMRPSKKVTEAESFTQMQEFAPKNTSPPPTEHWPGAEELAAYIDGTLDKAERERITEHLASCEECYSVYSETLHFQLDSSPAAPEGNVVPFRKSSREHGAWWWSSIAAAAAMVIVGVGGGGLYFLASPPALPTDQVISDVSDRSAAQDLWVGPTFRGEGDEGEGIPLDQAAFQMGVQLVNLQARLKAGRAKDAQDAIARILGLLKSQYSTEELRNRYTQLTGSLENRPPRDLLPDSTRLAHDVRKVFDADALDFGQWVEAGRLTALAGDPTFLQQPRSQRFLRQFLWRQKVGFGETKVKPEARQSLEAISDLLGKERLARPDYDELVGGFERILEIYYPAT
jgi:Putative zinc-finger